MDDYAMMVEGTVAAAPSVATPKAAPKAVAKKGGAEAPARGPFSDSFGQ